MEFKKIEGGTLLSNGFGPEVTIACDGCGHPVRRRVERLTDKQTVSCVNPSCTESYTIEKIAENEFTFERRLITFDCEDCKATNNLPWRKVEKMRVFEVSDVACTVCGVFYKLGAQLQIAKVQTTGGGA